MFATNLDGAFLATKHGVRVMRETGGVIVHIGLASGVRPSAGAAAYSTRLLRGTKLSRSSITGIPGHLVRNVTATNLRVTSIGGGTPDLAGRELPGNESSYPEATAWGQMPCHGLFVRHVAGLLLRDIRFFTDKPDARPAVICHDVADLRLDGLELDPEIHVEVCREFWSPKSRMNPGSIGDWHFAHFNGSSIVRRFSTDGFCPATFQSAQSLAWAGRSFVLRSDSANLGRRSTSRASSQPAGRSKVFTFKP